MERVIDRLTHLLLQPLNVFGSRPLERCNRAIRGYRPQSRAGLAGFGQQKSRRFDAVTHHVQQRTPALLAALPEPRLVRSAVLFGGACKIGPPRGGDGAPPDDVLAALDPR